MTAAITCRPSWTESTRRPAPVRARRTAHRQNPQRVARPAVESGPIVKIGDRISYGRRVMTGIYELQRLGRSPESIALMLRMPLDRVLHILKPLTAVRREIQKSVASGLPPREKDVMRRLAAESRA